MIPSPVESRREGQGRPVGLSPPEEGNLCLHMGGIIMFVKAGTRHHLE